MNQNQYSIAAVITAYNIGDHITRAIDSVLAQSLAPDEIIVVDDGSTDNTAEKIAEFGDKVKYIHQQNAGASAARNAGLNAASSTWIATLDGDDQWLAHHLENQVEILKQNPDLKWSTANFIHCLCDENRTAPHINPEKAKNILNGKSYSEDYFNAYKNEIAGHTAAMVIKKTALIEAGLFTVGQAKANDLDMWWRIAYLYPKIGFAPEPAAIYHMAVDNSISEKRFNVALYTELLGRHLDLAKNANRSDVFNPFAAMMIHRWIRAMLFDARGKDIKLLLNKFASLLSPQYKIFIRTLIICPKLSAAACRTISKIVRKTKLRPHLARKHRKVKI